MRDEAWERAKTGGDDEIHGALDGEPEADDVRAETKDAGTGLRRGAL